MTEDKKRAPRRLPFDDELEFYIRDADAETLRYLAVRVAKEARMREMSARRLPLLDAKTEEPLGGDGTPRGE